MGLIKKVLLLFLVCFSLFNLGAGFVLAEEEAEVEYATIEGYDLEVPIGSTSTVYGMADYINTVYVFGISVVGIVATIMIMFGGWQWIFAGGNEKIISSAKGYITSAIIGLVLALSSYLILFSINPNLVELNALMIEKISAPEIVEDQDLNCTWGSGTIATFAPVADSWCSGQKPDDGYTCYCKEGGCTPATTGACSVAEIEKYGGSCFGDQTVLEKASAICQGESAGSISIASGVDKCEPGGEAVSFGLFQINISANSVGGLDCPSAFSGGPYTGSDHTCEVIDQGLYDQCVALATNPYYNIQTACSLYSTSRGWKHWGYNNTHCYWTK